MISVSNVCIGINIHKNIFISIRTSTTQTFDVRKHFIFDSLSRLLSYVHHDKRRPSYIEHTRCDVRHELNKCNCAHLQAYKNAKYIFRYIKTKPLKGTGFWRIDMTNISHISMLTNNKKYNNRDNIWWIQWNDNAQLQVKPNAHRPDSVNNSEFDFLIRK